MTVATTNEELERVAVVMRDDPDLVLAFAFGSVADGSAGPTSDIDVAVLAAAQLASDHRRRLIAQLAEATGRPVDLIDLYEAGVPLTQTILSEGRTLLCRDQRAKELLITRMLADVEDFLPLRQRLLADRRERWIR